MHLKIIAATALTLLMPSCTDVISGWLYDRVETGELKGRLIVEWVDQDKFIFIPDQQQPLTFTRKNKDVIRPDRMYTDGGSVPPALRSIKSYSPWGYAPAFIIHDWLFTMKHCRIAGYEAYDLDKAATVMAEVMKTVMENPKYGGPNKLVLYSMYEAVRSSIAKGYWDNGTCDTPSGARSAAGQVRTERSMPSAAAGDPSRLRFVIEF